VLWRAAPRPGAKPSKVPYRIADPERKASSTNPATWGTFWDAVDAYVALVHAPADPDLGPIVGIAVVLTRAAGVACLDFDGVLDGTTLDPRVRRLVAHCQSWTELSPSGTGLHLFGRGTLARAIKGVGIEVYGDRHTMAVTGHRWPGTPPDLRNLQGDLDQLAALDRPAPRPAYTGPRVPPPDDLAGALLAKLAPWGLPGRRLRRWLDGYLVELDRCPWADAHTTGPGGAAVIIRASGAFDFVCQHAHCGARTWRDFRARMEPSA
jgi:hypothetical protein